MHHPPLQKCRTLTDEMGLKLIARPVAKKFSAAFLHFSQTAPLVLNRFWFAEMEPWVEKSLTCGGGNQGIIKATLNI